MNTTSQKTSWRAAALLACAASLGLVSAASAQLSVHFQENDQAALGSDFTLLSIDTTTLFTPLTGDVTLTGSIDLGTITGNSTVFAGLIAKDRYESLLASYGGTSPNWVVFAETAYMGFNTARSGQLGIGQRTASGELLSNYFGINIGNSVDSFEVTFSDTSFSGEWNSNTTILNYSDSLSTLNAGIIPTDFSQGAYAWVGVWNAGGAATVSYDLTFQGPGISAVPEPSTYGAIGAFLLLGLVARRRLQSKKA